MVLQEFLVHSPHPPTTTARRPNLSGPIRVLAHLQRKNAAAEHIACCSPPVFFVATITRRRRPF